MGWTGSGQVSRTDGERTGSRVWQDARDADQDVEAEAHDTHDEDMASAIAACLNLDGENSPRQNINWGGKKITNLAGGTGRGDAARIADIQDGAELWGNHTGGTASLQTLSLSPAVPALTQGMVFRFRVGSGLTNTGPVELSVNGTEPKGLLTRGGSDFEAGELREDEIYEAIFDGTNFRVMNKPIIRKRLVTADETYVVKYGLLSLRVRGVGGGGGGGGAGATNTAGGGGGAGEYVDKLFRKAALGVAGTQVAVTIGAGGAAGSSAGGDGGAGGDTLFDSFATGLLLEAKGGAGGSGMAGTGANAQAAGGAGGTAGSGTADVRLDGGRGSVGRLDGDGRPGADNFGGMPTWELAARSAVGTNGHFNPVGYGGGGGGGNRTSGASSGNVGRPGALELTEEF